MALAKTLLHGSRPWVPRSSQGIATLVAPTHLPGSSSAGSVPPPPWQNMTKMGKSALHQAAFKLAPRRRHSLGDTVFEVLWSTDQVRDQVTVWTWNREQTCHAGTWGKECAVWLFVVTLRATASRCALRVVAVCCVCQSNREMRMWKRNLFGMTMTMDRLFALVEFWVLCLGMQQ